MTDAMSEHMDAQKRAQQDAQRTAAQRKRGMVVEQRRKMLDKWREHRKNPPEVVPPMSHQQFVRHVEAHILTPNTRRWNAYSLDTVPLPPGFTKRQLNKVAKRVWKRRWRHELWQGETVSAG